MGLRTLVENHVDFTKNRNLCIAAVILVLAMGGATIGGPDFSFSGIGLGIIAGILLNLIMPESKEPKPGLVAHSVPEDEILSLIHIFHRYAIGLPDIHFGYGFPIGGVAAFNEKNGIVSPGGVGFDINLSLIHI